MARPVGLTLQVPTIEGPTGASTLYSRYLGGGGGRVLGLGSQFLRVLGNVHVDLFVVRDGLGAPTVSLAPRLRS